MSSREALPPGMRTLGYLGVVPFAALGAAMFVAHDSLAAHRLGLGLLAYGCAILAFLGAVHWGVLLSGASGTAKSSDALVAVLPAAAGAVSVVLPLTDGVGLQIISLAAFWLYEHRSVSTRLLPPPYLVLRRELTVIVLAVLVIVLFGPASGVPVRA